MCPRALRFVEIRTHDLVRAERFYSALFGWNLVRPAAGVPAATIDAGSGPVGVLLQVPPRVPRTVCPYVISDDCAAAARRAVERGAALLIERERAGDDAWFSLTLDPWGNHLALWEPNRPGPEGTDRSAGRPSQDAERGVPFVWLDLHAPQLDEAIDYYGAVLGWAFERFEPGPQQAPAARDRAAGVGLDSAELRAGHGSLVYIEVAALERCTAEIGRRGGTVLARLDAGPAGRPACVFSDPDDNALAVIQAAPGTSEV